MYLVTVSFFFQWSFLAHKDNGGGLSEIKALLEKLPASNYQLLKYLCNFLVKVSMNEGKFWTLSSMKNISQKLVMILRAQYKTFQTLFCCYYKCECSVHVGCNVMNTGQLSWIMAGLQCHSIQKNLTIQ